MSTEDMVWQLHDENEWRFGRMVRGVVREPYWAEIYFGDDDNYGWIWFIRVEPNSLHPRGVEVSFGRALAAAEKVLVEKGIIEKEQP